MRSALDSIRREHPGGDVVVVAHQVVLLVLRYVVEGLSEAEILAIDGEGDLVNGGLSTFVLDAAAGRLVVAAWNVGTHLPVEGVEPTREPPQPAEQSTGAGEPGRAALPERTR